MGTKGLNQQRNSSNLFMAFCLATQKQLSNEAYAEVQQLRSVIAFQLLVCSSYYYHYPRCLAQYSAPIIFLRACFEPISIYAAGFKSMLSVILPFRLCFVQLISYRSLISKYTD